MLLKDIYFPIAIVANGDMYATGLPVQTSVKD